MKAEVAKDILLRMAANFPGLVVDEGEPVYREIDGAELTEWITNEFYALRPDLDLQVYALCGSPDDDGEQKPKPQYCEDQHDR